MYLRTKRQRRDCSFNTVLGRWTGTASIFFADGPLLDSVGASRAMCEVRSDVAITAEFAPDGQWLWQAYF